MKRTLAGLIVVAGVLGLDNAQVWANDQRFVVGAGLGVYEFSKLDDYRQGSDTAAGPPAIKAGRLVRAYGEWYALGELGFGLLLMDIGGLRSYRDASGNRLDREAAVWTRFVTVNWVPIGSEADTRFGVVAGAGPARYKANEVLDSGPDRGSAHGDTASGHAALLGAYLDWGEADFGARAGVNFLRTRFGSVTVEGQQYDLDGSGACLYVDLRWAFR